LKADNEQKFTMKGVPYATLTIINEEVVTHELRSYILVNKRDKCKTKYELN